MYYISNITNLQKAVTSEARNNKRQQYTADFIAKELGMCDQEQEMTSWFTKSTEAKQEERTRIHQSGLRY